MAGSPHGLGGRAVRAARRPGVPGRGGLRRRARGRRRPARGVRHRDPGEPADGLRRPAGDPDRRRRGAGGGPGGPGERRLAAARGGRTRPRPGLDRPVGSGGDGAGGVVALGAGAGVVAGDQARSGLGATPAGQRPRVRGAPAGREPSRGGDPAGGPRLRRGHGR